MTLTGYHGTHVKHVSDIISNGFNTTIRDDHWLGQGIYFFDNLDLAKWWAETKFKHDYNNVAAVINVEIDALPEQILNLDSVVGMDYFFTELKKLLSSLNISLKFDLNKRTENFCWAIDLLKDHLGIGVVIRSFLKKRPTYGKHDVSEFEKDFFPLPSYFMYTETQLCVTNNNYIRHKECCFPKHKTRWM